VTDVERWDVVIVGAGPAGCAAAVSAARLSPGIRILLLDRAAFPRDKPCGDGIAAEALDVLAGLGFDVDAVTAGYPPVPRLRLTGPGSPVAERTMARPVRVIPRRVLDARLVAHVQRLGIELRRHTVRSLERRDEGIRIDGIAAGVVIGADGSESVVRRMLHPAPPRAGTVALAFRGYADEPADQAGTQVITMTRRHWPAYAWSFPDGTGRANVGYGELLGGSPPTRAAMLERMTRLLPELTDVSDLRAHRLPLSTGRPGIPDGRVLLAGDAQSLINPLTGEGIFYAVHSGELAGRAAAEGADAGRAYRGLMRRGLGRHFRHTSALAAATRWPAMLDAGVRAARDDQRSFDDILRVGLGDGLLSARLLGRLRP
jgi:geranylgeranyl reductase family protein